jgi:hypothetical protein
LRIFETCYCISLLYEKLDSFFKGFHIIGLICIHTGFKQQFSFTDLIPKVIELYANIKSQF